MKSAQILIDMNADPNYIDGLGRTYLMYAARAGFLPMVDLLISQGVDIDAADNDGLTALTISYKYKKDVIVKFLLKSGAQPWIKKPYNADQQSLIKELDGRWGNKNPEKQNETQK
jgi:ankyrin repeat protein